PTVTTAAAEVKTKTDASRGFGPDRGRARGRGSPPGEEAARRRRDLLLERRQAVVAPLEEPHFDVRVSELFGQCDAMGVGDDVVLHAVENQQRSLPFRYQDVYRVLVDFFDQAVADFGVDPLVADA